MTILPRQAGFWGIFRGSLTFGYRFEKGNAFYGPEADIDLFLGSELEYNNSPCSAGAFGPYYCSRDAVIRLRGIYGQSLNNGLEWFGSGGVGIMIGDGAVAPSGITDKGVNAGFTIGLGLQKSIGRGMLRGEVIYDRLNTSLTKPAIGVTEYEPDYEATTMKISYILSF
ncbi:hypothetical protein [Profundibacter sp.]|uniref:hypothetical protein n=1 Tax=Profundibacter sp. TaxID=3101071 RepID=UPI003D0F3FC3